MFYANDYMVSTDTSREDSDPNYPSQVQRGEGYVTTLRMFSSRTQNTECVNSQNVSVD